MKVLQTITKCSLVFFLLASSAAAEKIPMKAWVHDPVIDSVAVSPDGKQMIAITLPGVNEIPVITIWQLDDLSAPPKRYTPKDVKPLFVDWISNDRFVVLGRQKFDFRLSTGVTKWFRDKILIVDDEGKKAREMLPTVEKVGVSLENRLPQDKDRILVRVTTLEFADDLYEINLRNYSTKRVYRGSPRKGPITNALGEVASYIELLTGSKGARLAYSYPHPDTGKWERHHEYTAKDRQGLQPVGFDKDGVHVYMTDNSSHDKSVIRRYNLRDRSLSEPIFGDGESFEANVVQISTHVSKLGEVIGYAGYGSKRVEKLTDPEEAALSKMLEAALPGDYQRIVRSMSDDRSKMIIQVTGPREPGAFYLLQDKTNLLPLGRRFPNLLPEKLVDMKYVEYQARDGLTIPAYLATPATGEAPYPTVIMPHGGPWARDFYSWDSWVQFLANRGYAVMQPQYRGSDGWGSKLWKAGDREWGQKMQDDKDDGAAWLVEQGIAAKDRIAIYGYSYGGFAAMAAAVRKDSPYQCAISGAGLSELRTFEKFTFGNAFQREFQSATIAGMSPLAHVDDAEIPIYIFHGDRDQRVPVNQSQKFHRALQKAGKTSEYNEIPDLWHSLPWWPTHHVNVLGSIEEYLAERCGPGGL